MEDLHAWEMRKVKNSMKSSKEYTYWGASWREDIEVAEYAPGEQQEAIQSRGYPEGQEAGS